MKLISRVFGVCVLLYTVGVSADAQEMKRATPTRRVRIAALYGNELRNRYRKGIHRAKQEFERKIGAPVGVEITEFPYLNETKGLEQLINLIKVRNNGFDIVLEPTDGRSGVTRRSALTCRRVGRSGELAP